MTTVPSTERTRLPSVLALGAAATLGIGLTACSSDGTKTANPTAPGGQPSPPRRIRSAGRAAGYAT